ncbi:MAG: hypothetical protein QXM75_02650 [Candidatus Diapherotrites archaeon]
MGSMALWLYGSMALWLYGSMALRKRSKNIFIASKHRLMQLFQIVENHKTKNYSVLQNFAERGYLLSTAGGNLVRNGATPKAKCGKLVNRALPLFLQLSCLSRAAISQSADAKMDRGNKISKY